MRYLLTLLISLLTLGTLGGCGSTVPAIKPFKMDIQQGNVVTSKMLLQLKPGMTKSQVRYILGTPLIVDSFHKDRWDYFYQMRQEGKVIEQRRVILDFEKDLLAKVRGDVVPQGTPGAVSGEVAYSKTEPSEAKDGKDMIDRLKFWKSDKKPADTMAAEKAAEKSVAEKSVPEKSLMDKLKFWKKDDASAEAKAVESKPIEAAKEVVKKAAVAETPAEDVPSVLAVPIGSAAATLPDMPSTIEPNAPAVEAPAIEKAAEAVRPATPAKVDVPKIEAAKAAPPKLETPKIEAPKEIEPAKVEPVKIASPKAVVAKPVPSPVKASQPTLNRKPGEKKIFRLDRTLKTELLQESPPVEAVPAPIADKPVVEQAKKAVEEALPEEKEPGFFDRMLEKIGF